MPRVAVIGGGIAGLSAALRLALTPDVDVIVLEQDGRLGGKILTERRDSLVLEGGPDGFIAWKPQAKALCESLGLEVIRSAHGRSAIVGGGRIHRIPDGVGGAIPTRVMPTLTSSLLSVPGKLRLLAEPLVPRRRAHDDESVASFVRRRGGRETWDRVVEPLVTSMYAGDGDRLSVEAILPMLPDAERTHGGLLRAGRAARRSGRPTATAPTFLSTPAGLGAIVDAVTARIAQGGADIRTDTRVWGLVPTERGWTFAAGDAVQDVDGVILAIPAGPAARLVSAFAPELASDLDAIPYSSTAVVSLVYRAGDVPDRAGHGYVVPRAERNPVLACSIASAKFPQLCPPDRAVVRVIVGRHGQNALARTDAELVSLATGELARVFRMAVEPLGAHVFRWPDSIPQYVVGHRARLARIREGAAAYPGLELAGAAYRGVGIADCIASGDDAAGRVLRHVRGERPGS